MSLPECHASADRFCSRAVQIRLFASRDFGKIKAALHAGARGGSDRNKVQLRWRERRQLRGRTPLKRGAPDTVLYVSAAPITFALQNQTRGGWRIHCFVCMFEV